MNYNQYNKVVDVNGQLYWCQGLEYQAQISMYRDIEDLYEIEKDHIHSLLEDK